MQCSQHKCRLSACKVARLPYTAQLLAPPLQITSRRINIWNCTAMARVRLPTSLVVGLPLLFVYSLHCELGKKISIKRFTYSFRVTYLLTSVSLLFAVRVVEGTCLTLNDQVPSFRDYGSRRLFFGFNDWIHAISRDLRFSCHGNITGWVAYSDRMGTFATVTFQVWRLTATSGCRTYELVGSHHFSNVTTNSEKLLNVSAVEEFGLDPIPVQPGDVVGFYEEFSGGRSTFPNIQSNGVRNSLSYYMSSVNSTSISAVREVDICGSSIRTVNGTPVITATVVTEGKDINLAVQRITH